MYPLSPRPGLALLLATLFAGCAEISVGFESDPVELVLQPSEAVAYDVTVEADGRRGFYEGSVSAYPLTQNVSGRITVLVSCDELSRQGFFGSEESADFEVPSVELGDTDFPIRAECVVAFSASDSTASETTLSWEARLYLESLRGNEGSTDVSIDVVRR